MAAFKVGDKVRTKVTTFPFPGNTVEVIEVDGDSVVTPFGNMEIVYQAEELELVERAAQEKQP